MTRTRGGVAHGRLQLSGAGHGDRRRRGLGAAARQAEMDAARTRGDGHRGGDGEGAGSAVASGARDARGRSFPGGWETEAGRRAARPARRQSPPDGKGCRAPTKTIETFAASPHALTD